MFDCFLRYDGVDVVNAARTGAYADSLGLRSWFTPRDGTEGIGQALGETYVSPTVDGAPWYDSRFPDTGDFAGFEIVSMTPVLSHTTSRTLTPLLKGGGVVSPPYHGAREIVIRGVLIGKTRQSVVRGFAWLRHMLEYGAECDFEIQCEGRQMMMWTQCPDPGSSVGDDVPYRRFMYSVSLTEGPTVLRERDISGDCGSMIEVELTLTVANPYIFGQPYSVSAGGGTGTTYQDLLDALPTYADVAVIGDYIQVLNFLWTDGASSGAAPADPPPETVPECHFDPDCPIPPVLPDAPQTEDLSCHVFHAGGWLRTTLAMPSAVWPSYVELSPRIVLENTGVDRTDVRLRFSPDGMPPESFDHEFYVTWLPAGGVLDLDGINDRITLTCGGMTRDATHLVFSNKKARANRWPELTCGTQWNLSLDIPSDQDPTNLAVAAWLATREP